LQAIRGVDDLVFVVCAWHFGGVCGGCVVSGFVFAYASWWRNSIGVFGWLLLWLWYCWFRSRLSNLSRILPLLQRPVSAVVNVLVAIILVSQVVVYWRVVRRERAKGLIPDVEEVKK